MKLAKCVLFVALGLGSSLMAGLASAEEAREIRIATEGTYPPFSYLDKGKLTGFDVDIATAMCERMKVKCEIVSQEWDGMIPGLIAGKYDAIVASMNITEERKKKIDFSNKYYATPARFITVKDGGVSAIGAADLAGKSIGVQVSTTQSNYLEENYKDSDIKQYKTVDDAAMDLANGRIDAVFSDAALLYVWMKTKDGACCAFVGGDVVNEKYFGVGKGVGVRQGDVALREQFNKAIAELRADGTYEKINQKYFPFSIY
ncbi:Lysine-arginine-ornithine-binding periplasmic protein precursor [Pseudomonas sp. XWY-1]|uniref:lysine/arginine/ornithine ABC transporter substrate-binding protein n=1 Tax=Pseudomonas TaxID=286 RepID=UPI000CDC8721|nr:MULTISPECIES: lysine/arginine/ornithine ABC transporter substrate-binding protein [Pseudomonas]AUZ58569.1 Lysine-arginine-ornithine-binding periplasmic protein precursor [Pseudomonas sp. XWY-1]MDD2146767.1 lysine/arginine/ornithine ABC transporter substrate-binding protein [Pseudomonas putida]UVL87070.1 lysine/arginine/ornithine ABC transporter substrate-binding protein [Pseudomonas sichuanensis]HDS1705584.1 transporter substrate-binding domain-containing protein [Pseudomonas putida]